MRWQRDRNLSISTIPHPAVCLHSDRPVSGLISEHQFYLITFPCKSTVVPLSNILIYRCGGSIGFARTESFSAPISRLTDNYIAEIRTCCRSKKWQSNRDNCTCQTSLSKKITKGCEIVALSSQCFKRLGHFAHGSDFHSFDRLFWFISRRHYSVSKSMLGRLTKTFLTVGNRTKLSG